jgi:hypothetical protein
MKLKRQFTVGEWEETGELGWELPNCGPAYNAVSDPLNLAHDVLEHFSLWDIEDEFEAIGAMYWGRYETGFVLPYSYRSLTLDDLGAEFVNHLGALAYDDLNGSIPNGRKLEGRVEEDLHEITVLGHKAMLEDTYQQHDDIDRILAAYPAYFRRGYRKAQARYRHIGSGGFYRLFSELYEKFSSVQDVEEYQTLDLTIDLETGTIERFYITENWE